MVTALSFAADRHPRGQHGRFASAPSFSSRPLQETGMPRRSATKGEAWQRNGRLYAPAAHEIPIGYTGKREQEHEEGTMLVHEFRPQIPAKMPVAHWMGLMSQLGRVANDHMKPVIQKALDEGIKVPTHKFSGPKHTTWKVPNGTPRRSLVRAYIHGTKLAMHDFGVADYKFSMDEHLKDEMRPLVPFIRHVRRRISNEMNVAAPGGWRPFRAEFGQSFPTPKIDKRPDSPDFGKERKRMRPNQELVKRAPEVVFLRKAAPAAAGAAGAPRQPTPGVLQANPMLSRFARYRAKVARDESMGQRETKMLTPAQKLERVHAGIAYRRKLQSGAPRLQPGQPGSIAGQGIKRTRNPALPAPLPAPGGHRA